MARQALWVMLKARPGKEAEIEALLADAARMAGDEPGTVTWYGVKMGPGVYGIFDTFDDETGRDAHKTGRIAQTLAERACDLFSNDLHIESMEILAAK